VDDFSPRMPRRRRIASRLVSIEAATYLLVVLVAAALILYFFIRGRT
jgi:4-hydroxybenzoate polyprenyltransferase